MKTSTEKELTWASSARRLLKNERVSEATVAAVAGRTPPWVNQYLSGSRRNPTIGTVSEINDAIANAVGGTDFGERRRILDFLTSLAALDRDDGESLRSIDEEDSYSALSRFQSDYLKRGAVESILSTILKLPPKLRKRVIAALSAFTQRARLQNILFDVTSKISPFEELQRIFKTSTFTKAGLSLDEYLRDDERFRERLRLDDFETALRRIIVRITTCVKCQDEATNAQRHFAHGEIQKGIRAVLISRYE